MARSKKLSRRNRRLLLAAGVLAFLVLALWFCIYTLLAPNIAPRVLYSETAGCTTRERQLVAGVMKNRIANPAFGNSPTLEAVVRQPGAFSCIGDPDNANWQKTLHPDRLKPAERATWEACIACLQNIPPAYGPSGRPLVYYHDKSITKPRAWDNAKWHAVRELTTEHFVFYSIVPAK